MRYTRFPSPGDQAAYDTYYMNQAGSGLPFYSGARVQSGYGLGSILGGLIRSAVPLLKPALKSVGREVAKSGFNVVKDVVGGESFKTAAKRRLQEGAERSLRAATGVLLPSSSSGVPFKKKKRQKKSGSRGTGIKRRNRQVAPFKRKTDIFR